MSTAILKQNEIAGPVNYILANYILFIIKKQRNSPDADEFGDALIEECEKGTRT